MSLKSDIIADIPEVTKGLAKLATDTIQPTADRYIIYDNISNIGGGLKVYNIFKYCGISSYEFNSLSFFLR